MVFVCLLQYIYKREEVHIRITIFNRNTGNHLSKEQDTVLFKTGNVHKCTENDKTQSCAFIDKKTAHVQFKTKVRRSKEVQITEVQSDVEVEINQWISLTFARKRLPKGSDQLYIFINGKIAGTTDITYGNNVAETKNGDISEGTKSNTDNIPIINISNAVHQPASSRIEVAPRGPALPR